VQVHERNVGKVESDCQETFIGASCTVTCTLSREAEVYTCDMDGIWGGSGSTLDCLDVLAPVALFGLIGKPIEVPIPSTTTEIQWDPEELWTVFEPHHGPDSWIKGIFSASFAIIDRCMQRPDPSRGTMQKLGNGTLEVQFDRKEGRDEAACKYDFKQMEVNGLGYTVLGLPVTRGVFRFFQGDNATYYDQTVFFYESPLKTSALIITETAVYATADGPELVLHTSQSSSKEAIYDVGVEATFSPTVIDPYPGFGAETAYRTNNNSVLPEGLALDLTTGIISGVPQLDHATSKEVTYQVDVVVEARMEKAPHTVFADSTTQAAKFTLTVSPPIRETGQSGFKATVGSVYTGALPSVSGGREPLIFSYDRAASTADLPDGLEINSNTGQITGTPTTPSAGEVTMAVLVTDANQATKNLQTIGLTINPSISVTWTNALPTTVVDETYPLDTDLERNETDLKELVFRLDAGSELPPGLKLDCSGQIYGIATTPGKYTFNLTATDSEGSQASVTVNGEPVQIIVAECTDSFTCTGHGACDTGGNTTDSLYNGNYTCQCDLGWDGQDCASCAIHWIGNECDACSDGWSGVECNIAASTAPAMSDATIGGLSSGVVFGLLIAIGVALVGRRQLKSRAVKKRIVQLEALAFADIESINTASLDGVLFEAIKLKCFALIQPLLIRGANASKRDAEMQLPITRLLSRKTGDRSSAAARKDAAAASPDSVQLAADDRTDAAHRLLAAHFEFDLTLGLAMVEETFFETADLDGDGTLTFEECEARGMPAEVFAEIDTDENGTIDMDEFQVWITQLQREKTAAEFGAWKESQNRTKTNPLIRLAIQRIASANWRAADGTNDCVAHRLLNSCRERSLSENQTVELLEIALEADPAIMIATNTKNQTPTELAITCEGKLEIQTRFTVVLFNRYQIARPKHPLYKSPTAEVHECIDLKELVAAASSDNAGSNKRFVVKLMSNPDLWMRELKTRDALGADAADSYVGAISAAIASPSAANAAQHGAAGRAASQYAALASTDVRPIATFETSFAEQTRRDEARHLMKEYPYAIQMPLADRNLNEIIASERLAEEPLDVIRQSSRKVLNLIQDLHNSGVVHGDVKPKNVVRVDRTLMLIDLDMSITVGSSEPPAHSNPEKFSGSTAYAAPELHQWMAEQEANGFVDDGSSPLDKLAAPQQIDLWSFAVTLYEMATGSPLFQNSYDRAASAALVKLKDWSGLDAEHLNQIESLHGAGDSAALRDVLMWALDGHASSRPQSVAELVTHAFFDPRGGAMRENFVVNQIKQLLQGPPPSGEERVDAKVMVSYSWADSNFVLSRLTMALAPRVQDLWLDRLGGDHGMGEFAKASMQRGIQNADVIIAVVSPAYINSVNCGYEMEVAHAMGKLVIPVVLNVPFNEWPPKQIGQSAMNDQFATEAGDVKIFVDMTDSASFFQKFQQELLPRLDGGPGGFQSTLVGAGAGIMPPPPLVEDEIEAATKAALASDAGGMAAGDGGGGSTTTAPALAAARSRPKKGHNKVAPTNNPVPTDDVRGDCGRCGQPVLESHHRTKQKGVYYHDDCPE
jgi:serine/threonine protein kinase